MNKIVAALLTISILNALALPNLAGERKSKSISNPYTDDQISRSNQIQSGQNYSESKGEISMIEIQSIVRNGGNSIQLTTGMAKSINKSDKQISGNIRR